MRLRKLPLRWLLPSVVFISIMLISVFSVFYTLNSQKQQLIQDQQAHALKALTALSRLGEHQLASDPRLVTRELQHRAANRHVEQMAILDEQLHIITSHERALAGQNIQAHLPAGIHDWLTRHTQGTQRVRSPHLDMTGTHRLHAVVPFQLQSRGDADIVKPGDDGFQRGFVFAEYDLAPALTAITYAHIQQRLPDVIGAFILALLLAVWLQRRITRPIDQLTTISDQVAKGDFSQRVSEARDGELSQLASRFNRMVRELAESQAQKRLAAVAFETAEATMVCAPDGRIEQVNQAFTQTTGYTAEQAVGQKPSLLKSGWHDASFYQNLWNQLQTQGFWQGKIINRHRDGHTFPQWTVMRAVYDEDGSISHYVTSFFDLTEQEAIRQALEKSEQRFRSIFNQAPIAYQALDIEGRFVDVNQRLCEMLDYTRDDLLGRPFFDFWAPELQPQGPKGFKRFVQTGEAHHQLILLRRDGTRLTVMLEGQVQRNDKGEFVQTHCVLFDVTARAEMEQRLARREEQLRNLIDAMPDMVILFDHQGHWLETNRYNLNLFGIDPNAYSDKASDDIARDNPAFAADLERINQHNEAAWQQGTTLRQEETLTDRYGIERIFDVIRVPQFYENGQRKGLVLIGRDVTEQRAAQQRAEQLAFYDTLTNLPNRLSLHQALNSALEEATQRGHFGALLQLDIDHFKTINDARGHKVGDALLRKLAARLKSRQPSNSILAHTGGDEFALALPDLGTQPQKAADEAFALAETINESLSAPFIVNQEVFHLSTGIGIALFPERAGTTPGDVLREADTAMYQAKHAGRSHIRFYQHEMGNRVEQRLDLESRLRQALAKNALSLFIQCQVDDDGKRAGGEVLLRWNDPKRGMISPGLFIPIAEESGLIIPIGEWVLRETCQLLTQMRQDGKPLALSVNISPRQFKHPAFIETVEKIIVNSGVHPGDLTFEITEGLIIDHVEETIAKMQTLAQMGIRFSLDDFGTGYSSLSYLKRLPIHELKIDKSFVIDAPTDPNDAALVDAVLAVCRHLQLSVVAEGVETVEHANFLRRRAQMLHQGFYYCKPQPAADFCTQWLEGDSQ